MRELCKGEYPMLWGETSMRDSWEKCSIMSGYWRWWNLRSKKSNSRFSNIYGMNISDQPKKGVIGIRIEHELTRDLTS